MGCRVVLAWIEGRLRAAWSGADEDCDDWLAGNDEAIVMRDNERRLAAVAASGGAVG